MNEPGNPYGSQAEAMVSWTAPASNGGSPITGYTVYANNGGGTCSPPGSSTTCLFEGLTPGTTYTFTVVALNAIGTSASSAPVSCTVSTVPDTPTAVTGTPVLNVPYGSAPEVSVNWTAPNNGGAAISGYTVTASPGGATCSSATTTCTISSGLTLGTAYTFTVTATNVSGTGLVSAASSPVTTVTAPQAPTIGTATYVTGIPYGSAPQVTVTWADPANNGGDAIIGYTVTSSPSGGTCTAGGATSTGCTITSGLTAGTSYTFTVTATSAAGTGAASGSTAAITPATVPQAPSAVTAANVSGIPYGTQPQAKITWTDPANGGSAITGYTVTANTGGGTCTAAGARPPPAPSPPTSPREARTPSR